MTVRTTRIIISMITKILLNSHSQRTIRSHIQANFQNTRERLQERHYLLLQIDSLQRDRRIVQRHYRFSTHEIAWLWSIARLSQLQLLQSADTSLTSDRFYDRTSLYDNEESDLATTILKLLRSDNLKLKTFTEVQVRHEIDLTLDVSEIISSSRQSRDQLWFKSQSVREDLQSFMNFKLHVTYL